LHHKHAKKDVIYAVTWKLPEGGRKVCQFTHEDKALVKAQKIAAMLNTGKFLAAAMTEAECIELEAARRLTHPLPLLAVVQEWRRIQEFAHNHALEAATDYANRKLTAKEPVDTAIPKFIKSKNDEGLEGDLTYKSKLNHLIKTFLGRHVDSIPKDELNTMLNEFKTPCTRNAVRKRCITFFNWCKKQGWLPQNAPSPITETHKSYRVPLPKNQGKKWFNLFPKFRKISKKLK
jgi:hypothetical protein